MAVELWLVRHGQAAFATDDYDRLTDLGWQQARWLGEHLSTMETRFDRICAGTLRRQQETASAIADLITQTDKSTLPEAELRQLMDIADIMGVCCDCLQQPECEINVLHNT